MRILTIITGVLLVLTSIWCFAHPGATFASLAFILGCVMLFHGISGVLNYISTKDTQNGASWVLSDGIITFILACIVLSNQLAIDAIIPLFFGMWILFSGTMRIVASINLKKLGEKAWGITFALGLIGMIAGIYSFFNSIAAGLALVLMIGIFFLLQGVNMLTLGIGMIVEKRK